MTYLAGPNETSSNASGSGHLWLCALLSTAVAFSSYVGLVNTKLFLRLSIHPVPDPLGDRWPGVASTLESGACAWDVVFSFPCRCTLRQRLCYVEIQLHFIPSPIISGSIRLIALSSLKSFIRLLMEGSLIGCECSKHCTRSFTATQNAAGEGDTGIFTCWDALYRSWQPSSFQRV